MPPIIFFTGRPSEASPDRRAVGAIGERGDLGVIAAQRPLETTALAVEDIADRIGMGSAANRRHHFRACLQTTPTHYRRTFRGA